MGTEHIPCPGKIQLCIRDDADCTCWQTVKAAQELKDGKKK